jgi:hypothetical protein
LRYANDEIPMQGDRIRNSAGALGTVTSVLRASASSSEPIQITVKWDEGIVGIDYDVAQKFSLVSRAPGRIDDDKRLRNQSAS